MHVYSIKEITLYLITNRINTMPVNIVDELALNEERRKYKYSMYPNNRNPTMPNNTILITPEQTLVQGKAMTPDNISIVLENGHSYDIDNVIDLLEKFDKKHAKKTPLRIRVKNGFSAFKQAMKETELQPK